MQPMTTDVSRDDLRPYFLWNTPMTSGELRERLRVAEEGAWFSS